MVKIKMETVPVQSVSAVEDGTQVCYNVEWKPDVELLDPIVGQNYFRQLLLNGPHEPDDTAMDQKCQLQSILYVLDAVKSIDGNCPADLSPTQLKYLAWLRHQAWRYSQGLIEHQTPEWEVYVQDESLKAKFLEEVQNISVEAKLTKRMGSQLIPILWGEVDPLQLMFGDDLLDSYYQEGLGTKNVHRQLQNYLERYSHKYINLRVLEIGAGLGSATGT
jgi:hypothetical protein